MGKHCREWPAGKTESEVKLLIQENSEPQDLIVYTDGSFTIDQSGWGFTVKQGATTIHEDSAAYTVSTSSLTMEVEVVTQAFLALPQEVTDRSHIPSSSQLATYSAKWNGKPRLECADGRHLPSKIPVGVLPWTCRSERKRPSRQTGGQTNPHKRIASRKI